MILLIVNGLIDGLFVFEARGIPLYILGYCLAQIYKDKEVTLSN